jgi:hypothetical protein
MLCVLLLLLLYSAQGGSYKPRAVHATLRHRTTQGGHKAVGHISCSGSSGAHGLFRFVATYTTQAPRISKNHVTGKRKVSEWRGAIMYLLCCSWHGSAWQNSEQCRTDPEPAHWQPEQSL